MRFFLRSRRFKIICSCVAALLVISIGVRIVGGTISPQSSLLGAIAQPFRAIATYCTDKVNDFNTRLNGGTELMKQNEALQSRVDELSSQVIDYDKIKKENEFLKGFLELKENNQDFQFVSATRISRDNDDAGYMFTVNKGTVNGVQAKDPVITSAGLVGYVSEVGPSYAKVTTILSDDMNVGCVDYRTSDVGIVSGKSSIAKEGKTRFYNLPRSCSVARNDIIVTSGGGIFPEGIIVGTIDSLSADKDQTSITATVNCAADILNVKDVMIITYFDGQGDITDR